MQSRRNIDVITTVMKDRCLMENFTCLSLAENIHKKIIFNQQLELAADTMLGSIDFKTGVRHNLGRVLISLQAADKSWTSIDFITSRR